MEVFLVYDDNFISIKDSSINIGDLPPSSTIDVVFTGTVVNKLDESISSEIVFGHVEWSDFEGEKKQIEFEHELEAQSQDIDWEFWRREKPYVLEAVETEEQLVGRTELLSNLQAKFMSNQLESSIIYGQKRVGKTSIAKTIRNMLNGRKGYTVLLPTEYLDKDPETFLNKLGEEICLDIEDELGIELACPDFKGSISPLGRHFKRVKRIKPEQKFIIILDEFDQIPAEFHRKTPIGETFFLNLRSLSSEGQLAFLLVGGENMKDIMGVTDTLNKFEVFSVDYFNRNEYWNDFQDLVRKPVNNVIEFSDKSVAMLYDITEGNPFFTKLVCARIFSKACELRNAHISVDEVNEAFHIALNSTEINNVNHFWLDGISEDDPANLDLIRTHRRKLLLAYADTKRRFSEVKKEQLIKSGFVSSIPVEQTIESFTRRNIWIEEEEQEKSYRCKPKFFDEWLVHRGYTSITSAFQATKAIEALKSREAKAFVRDQEIIALSKKWGGIYKGVELGPSHIRSWLNQFSNNIERRLMFNLLSGLRFYNEALVRSKLSTIHRHVSKPFGKDIQNVNVKPERFSRNVLLSAFGNINKSGSMYTRLYASTNEIIRENIVHFDKIASVVEENDRIRTLVFLDDITSSGDTAVKWLKELNQQSGELLSTKDVQVVLAFICGFEEGIQKINTLKQELPFKLETYICDIFLKSDQCFSEESRFFRDESERIETNSIAYKYGRQLRPDMPLGYRNNQLLVTFHETCPDNSLPILWADKLPSWQALFRKG